MKICPEGAELMHANGQTDKHDLANSRFFCKFANMAKNELLQRVLFFGPCIFN